GWVGDRGAGGMPTMLPAGCDNEPVSEFVVITGLSGAGRSTAAVTFEDLGWFKIDNLPPALIPKVAELASAPGAETQRVALAVGSSSPYLDELAPALEQLKVAQPRTRVVFLEAPDDILVRRFENTRRRHPLDAEGVAESIRRERAVLGPVKDMADVVIDTGDLNVHQLRDRLIELFARHDPAAMRTSVLSFGYKYGIPLDADLVLDCRFIPNPHWVDELRPLTGLDGPVQRYVLDQPETKDFLRHIDDLLGLVLPLYAKEGKSYLTIAVGCTGGRHRAPTLAHEIAGMVAERGFDPSVHHRDVER
ncbi:MAG: RNase adapter RapZ, partial [Acidimicrobiales bacterium]